MISNFLSRTPRKIRILVIFLLIFLLSYFLVRFFVIKPNKIPTDFLRAESEASLIAKEREKAKELVLTDHRGGEVRFETKYRR